MRLNIIHNTAPHPQKQAAQAAFINSNDPRVWFRELSRFGQSAADWACYAVPESVQSVAVAGVFVVVEKADLEHISPHLTWFYRIGTQLYVPMNAELDPSVSEAELAKMLNFNVQLFHPTIGFVGFNAADRLDLGQILELEIAENTDWGRAQEGLPPSPKLNEISVLQPVGNDLIEAFRQGLERKSLSDIPLKDGSKNEGQTAFDKLSDAIKAQLLKGGLGALNALNNMLPDNSTGKAGFMDAAFQWLNDRQKALDDKRETELQRLLDLFKNDPDEALKYALPLDSPYADRGTATPTGGLSPRSTDFNLGQLGGGQATDNWNTNKHYYDLRKQYIDAANRAIQNEDYRRAAYIFAHLLGDFNSAANTLEQGGFFREAAALHREHLKNLAAAAMCLEKGKLYLEAIELYQKLEQNEKIGDLCKLIGQDKNAAFYYEKCVENALNSNNFTEAARLENQKMGNLSRAKATLLRGWSAVDATNSETCLKQYFDLVMLESDEEAARQIEPIFKNSPQQNDAFLSVLINVNGKYGNPSFQNAARPIAYQIVSQSATNGNRASVNDLEHFLPEDALIGKDVSRFLHQKPRKPQVVVAKKPTKIQLDTTVRWLAVFSYYDYFVAIGRKDRFTLYVVRGTWTGSKLESQTVICPKSDLDNWGFANSPRQKVKDQVLAWLFYDPIDEFSLLFEKNDVFSNDLVIFSDYRIPNDALAVGILDASQIVVIRHFNDQFTISFYTPEGQLSESTDCMENGEKFYLDTLEGYIYSLLFYQGWCLFYSHTALIIIDFHGVVMKLDIGFRILQIYQSSFEKNIFILQTDEGKLIIDIEKMNPEDPQNDAYFFGKGEGSAAYDILFVSPTDFVVLIPNEIIIYSRRENSAVQNRKILIKNQPKSLLRTNERTQFAVLFEDGLIEFFDWI
jgi:hypothetical protein